MGIGRSYRWVFEKDSFRCNKSTDTFLTMLNIRLPLNTTSYLSVLNTTGCKLLCLRFCSCNAYAYVDGKCFIWQEDLLNLQQLSSNGYTFYLRLRAFDLAPNRKVTWIVIGTLAGLFSLFGIVFVVMRRRNLATAFEAADESLVLFKYRDLRSATKNFSEKLGEGGFGSVFKGILPNSIPVAVKTLKSLNQTEKQFLAEVRTLGTIQHINLVRLRGFCTEASKKFLVYDFVLNGSLESILFQNNARLLNWKTRVHIAVGIAKGLSYLHEECRDCIIHCDIKPENILLDDKFNPKVADFGLAKLIGRDFSRVLTTMRGTLGDLAPEWISGVTVTPKADVFSYGMLLFEVISGRRNSHLLDDDFDGYFPSRVAIIVNKGEDVLTLLDHRLKGNANIEELTRACRVACWCIQDDEKYRPNMRQVVQILEGVSEVNIPPVPCFIRQLFASPGEAAFFKETASSSDSWH
ncbi:putative S-receptor kinase [Quillaja saponaria]|uniref:non-specific serine/threonine protein kinase n=1 Tax=Quillaja saponaria TaxID=32244 RepID=A0AAD7QHD6_QUISA|nr:putative S-receptor kinase [Quillaja saponaria]